MIVYSMPKRGDIFKFISNVEKKRTKFNLSHQRLTPLNMGDLTPIYCDEVLPGDTFKLNMQNFIRAAPMLAPLMHRVDIKTEFWFVPARLLWDKWDDFITGGELGDLAPSLPFFNLSDDTSLFQKNSLANHLGVPVVDSNSVSSDLNINTMLFRAYQFIWLKRYRDENLDTTFDTHWWKDSVFSVEGEEQEMASLATLRKRCWEKDYFTSALPFAQKGEPVTLNVGGTAPVYATAESNYAGYSFAKEDDTYAQGSLVGIDEDGILRTQDGSTEFVKLPELALTLLGGQQIGDADLSQATGITMNDLRILARTQEFLEKNARGGSRPKEMLYQHFGVISPDARLQDPEYLGGGSLPLQISEVVQTNGESGERADNRVGDMYGHGISAGSFHGIKKHTFLEHGYIIGVLSIMPRTGYSQGLPKMFSRFDKLDFAWPTFGNIGEQEVKNKEIFMNSDNPEGTFGYQSRYAEYKYKPDEFIGDFTDNLAFWHLGRIFEDQPVLDEEFVQCKPRTDIFAVTDEEVPHFWCDLWFNIQVKRALPKFGTPALL